MTASLPSSPARLRTTVDREILIVVLAEATWTYLDGIFRVHAAPWLTRLRQVTCTRCEPQFANHHRTPGTVNRVPSLAPAEIEPEEARCGATTEL
jgi:hypothetical protein